MGALQTDAERARRKRNETKAAKPMLEVEVEYLGEDYTVEILVPRWAMHKLKGGEPSDLFEDEGGESMWELYVQDQGQVAAKKKFEAAATAAAAADKVKNDKRLQKLKESFDIFDEDGSGELSTEEVLTILTRMGGGTALTDEDAKEFIEEFDRNGK